MNNILLAAAKSAEGNANSTQSMILLVVFYAAIFLIFWLLFFRPQKKRQKKEEEMRSNVSVGDNIITMGGICGRIVSIRDEDITIESSADKSKITIKKWAISSNLSVPTDTKKK